LESGVQIQGIRSLYGLCCLNASAQNVLDILIGPNECLLAMTYKVPAIPFFSQTKDHQVISPKVYPLHDTIPIKTKSNVSSNTAILCHSMKDDEAKDHIMRN
jgi:hypothetical protein